MKNVFIAAIIAVVSTACTVGARRDTLPRDRDETLEENVRLRKELVRLRQEKGQQPTAPQGAPAVAQGGQVSTGTMWARQKHGVYMGTVGAQPRQMTQGRKINITNVVCDDNARDSGSNCSDADGNGAPDYNTWLSFEIDGQPVICDSGIFHPIMGTSMLPPTQSCFVEIGAVRKFKLTVKEFRNNGNPWSYADLDATPYATFYMPITVGNGTESRRIDETFD
jgi:hypothetical protein